MAEYVIKIGARSAQGPRPKNEDRFVADAEHQVYLVADGMGGQASGERASGMAADIIPRVVQDRLAAHEKAAEAIREALAQANEAILRAGAHQPPGKHMGTTAVLA